MKRADHRGSISALFVVAVVQSERGDVEGEPRRRISSALEAE